MCYEDSVEDRSQQWKELFCVPSWEGKTVWLLPMGTKWARYADSSMMLTLQLPVLQDVLSNICNMPITFVVISGLFFFPVHSLTSKRAPM